jgi:hypothetical protein
MHIGLIVYCVRTTLFFEQMSAIKEYDVEIRDVAWVETWVDVLSNSMRLECPCSYHELCHQTLNSSTMCYLIACVSGVHSLTDCRLELCHATLKVHYHGTGRQDHHALP